MIMVSISIWYYKNNLCAVSFNEKCIWDSGLDSDVITEDSKNFIKIDVELPWMVAIHLCITICNGVSIERLKQVIKDVKERTEELIAVEQRNAELDLTVGPEW